MNRDLPIGTPVMLAVHSRFARSPSPSNPIDVVGTIIENLDSYSDWIRVDWGFGYTNTYPPNEYDLAPMFRKTPTFKTRDEARAAAKDGLVVVDLGSEKEMRWSVSVKEI